MVGPVVLYTREKRDKKHSLSSRLRAMLRSGRIFASVFLVVLFGRFSRQVDATLDPDTLDRKLVALFKVIDYVYNRPEQMNVDATFGITLTEANIGAALLHENVRYLGKRYSEIFKELLELCELTRKRLLLTVVPENQNVRLLFEALNSPDLWIHPISWKRDALGKIPNPSLGLTHRVAVNLTMQGTPQEEESDECLSEIVRSKLRGQCRIPDNCVDTLQRNDGSRGYPLTHRLLIVQIARTLDCPEDLRTPFSKMIQYYCSSILQDLVDIESADFPLNTRDLMSEQILLCGSEGFLEFMDKRYENLILSWPHSSGCFSAFGFPKSSSRYSRRTSEKTDFGCDSHATGLAAASLSLFIRKDVENAHEY